MVAVTLQRVLKAERDITVAQLAALAPVLGMTPAKLLAKGERRRPDDSQRSGEHRRRELGVRAGAACEGP